MKLIKLKLSYIAFLLFIAMGFSSCQNEDILEQTQELDQKTNSNSSLKKSNNGQDITTASSASLRVLVNGNPLIWPNSGANPVNANGYVMVHMNTIFTRLGYSVQWIQSDPNRSGRSSVVATKTGKTIQIWVGDTWAKVNGNWVQASVAPYNNNGYVMVHSRFIADHSGSATEWDQQTTSVQIYYYDELDYGFYFFDNQPGTNPTADAVGCQKYVPGVANSFFDPTKPTIIYVHGNAPGSVGSQSREDFLITGGGLNLQSHNIWKQQGWNVAIFYWIQFADEGLLSSAPPADVEAKIYDHTVRNGMRWRKSDGSFSMVGSPQAPVRTLFASKYLEIFNSNYSGAEIRIVGNSLGGNLTMAALLRLHNLGASRMPSRVTLMDPFWTPLNDNTVNVGEGQPLTSELAGLSAEVLSNRGIAIEYFRTSLLGGSGASERTARASAFSHFGSSFVPAYNPFGRHTVPVRQYFHSRGVAAPIEIFRPNAWTAWSNTGNRGPSAATPNSEIRDMMRSDRYWNQIDDRETATMGDDRFEIRTGTW